MEVSSERPHASLAFMADSMVFAIRMKAGARMPRLTSDCCALGPCPSGLQRLDVVKLQDRIHPRGLSLFMQRRVYFRRTVHKESWRTIATKVKNMKKKTPGWKVCRYTFNRITARNPKKSDYSDCGRPATITTELRKWIVSQLRFRGSA